MPDAIFDTADRPMLADPEGQFAANYNRQRFQFRHGLADHALFGLDSLRALAARMPDHSDTYWSNGPVDVAATWETGRDGRLTLDDTIANIARNNSLVILKHAEQDAEFGPLLRDYLARTVALCGERMRADVTAGEVLILISSPNRLTPYHIDSETNFLVQVTGDKTLCVFDHDDRSLVRHEELEAYFSGNYSGAKYREERQVDATTYDLKAGTGVHIPPFAPHWVRNHDNVSVALSVNYELRSIHRLGRVYRMNALLRQAGMAPAAPGGSALRDGAKVLAGSALAAARQAVKPTRRPAYPVWRVG